MSEQVSLNKIEETVYKILNRLDINVQPQVKIDKYTVDFLVDNKYIIECYGDFWHCNPQKYTAAFFNKGKKKTAQEIWNRDCERRKKFEELGYSFLFLWESEIKTYNTRTLKNKIKKFLDFK